MENLNETQEMIVRFAERCQNIDEQIADLKESRKEILKEAKDEGINHSLLNKVINAIRAELKKDPATKAEEELYLDLLKESHVIELLD